MGLGVLWVDYYFDVIGLDTFSCEISLLCLYRLKLTSFSHGGTVGTCEPSDASPLEGGKHWKFSHMSTCTNMHIKAHTHWTVTHFPVETDTLLCQHFGPILYFWWCLRLISWQWNKCWETWAGSSSRFRLVVYGIYCFLCFSSLPVQWLVTFFITSLLWEESILPQPSVDHRGIIGSQKNRKVGKDLSQPPVSPMKPCPKVPHPRSHKPNPIKSDSNVPAGEYIFSLLLQL